MKFNRKSFLFLSLFLVASILNSCSTRVGDFTIYTSELVDPEDMIDENVTCKKDYRTDNQFLLFQLLPFSSFPTLHEGVDELLDGDAKFLRNGKIIWRSYFFPLIFEVRGFLIEAEVCSLKKKRTID